MDQERNLDAWARVEANANGSADEPERLKYFLSPRLGAAKRHPYYHRILRDAYALLRADLKAFSGELTWDEICSREYAWGRRNTFGSAVVTARDALGIRRHGIANHESTVRDLKKMCCGGKQFRRREVD